MTTKTYILCSKIQKSCRFCWHERKQVSLQIEFWLRGYHNYQCFNLSLQQRQAEQSRDGRDTWQSMCTTYDQKTVPVQELRSLANQTNKISKSRVSSFHNSIPMLFYAYWKRERESPKCRVTLPFYLTTGVARGATTGATTATFLSSLSSTGAVVTSAVGFTASTATTSFGFTSTISTLSCTP